ncbi:hypothetical protein [Rhizobacter sp. LjRoot28]
MEYSLFLFYFAGVAALVAGSIGVILWLVRRESRRLVQGFDELLNKQ